MPADHVIDPSGLDALIGTLRDRGYTVVGPTVGDGAIVLAEIQGVADLPAGWTDEQDAGRYRLRRRTDDAVFGHAVGAHAWKAFLFPPRTRLWAGRRTQDGFETEPECDVQPTFAFLGIRGCDLAGIAVQDRVFLGAHPDPVYRARRNAVLMVAVNCSTPAPTCFCTSMGTGPGTSAGYDLALTELLDREGHRFLVEVGTPQGADVLEAVPRRPATRGEQDAARQVVSQAAQAMERTLDTDGLKERLYASYEHPHWDAVASRCLSCANCTMVCPTCFCSTVEDTTDLTGEHAERWRSWDSCFALDFSQLGGGVTRASTRSRYRQWLTHKLATWIDQFGTSGCVGCGRCITWCPVGIDLTEEVRALANPEEAAT